MPNLPHSTIHPRVLKKLKPTDLRIGFQPKEILQNLSLVLKEPQTCWVTISRRSESLKFLFERYVFLLAAIPSISWFIGQLLSGKDGLGEKLIYAISFYFFSFAFLYGATYLAHSSAKMFDGNIPLNNAAKLVIYSFTPFFVSGLFLAIPPLAFGAAAGCYSFYLFYLGVKYMTGIPQAKQFTYFSLNIVSWMVASQVFLLLAGL